MSVFNELGQTVLTNVRQPRTLFYDIETSPLVFWGWGTGKQVVGAHQIRSFGKIICISYRFSDWPTNQVKSLSWDKNQDDKTMVEKFFKIADSAERIVGHNGDKFDCRTLNSRLAYHHIGSLSHVLSEDTLKQSRKHLALPSYRLDALCRYFDLPGKLSNPNDLWPQVVFAKDREALKHMVTYCEKDVIILEALYNRLYPYVNHKIDLRHFNEDPAICPGCGSRNLMKWGKKYLKSGIRQTFKCKLCDKRFS